MILSLLVASALMPRTLTIACPPALASVLKGAVSTKETIVWVGPSAAADVRVEEPATDASPGREFAQDRIEIVTHGDRIQKVSHLGYRVTIAYPTPIDPVGRHVAQTIALLGAYFGSDWLANVRKGLTLRCATPHQAVEAVRSGQADAALVDQMSLAGFSDLRTVPIQVALADEIHYVATPERSNPTTKRFIDDLFTERCQTKLEKAGLTSPLRPTGELVIEREAATMRIFTSTLPIMAHLQTEVHLHGRSVNVSAASYIALFDGMKGSATFIGADRTRFTASLDRLRREGGRLAPTANGDVDAVFPPNVRKEPMRWVRRIEVR